MKITFLIFFLFLGLTIQEFQMDVSDILQNNIVPRTHIEIKYPDSSSAIPNSNYPSNLFDIGGWISYLVFLFVLFLIFILVGLQLFCTNLTYCLIR